MTKLRNRLVNFRVSDEEFERLKAASGRQGARCLSDFARGVMLGQSNILPASGSFDDRFVSLDRRLSAVEQSIAQLLDELSRAQFQPVGLKN
jgi:hypothetical protein